MYVTTIWKKTLFDERNNYQNNKSIDLFRNPYQSIDYKLNKNPMTNDDENWFDLLIINYVLMIGYWLAKKWNKHENLKKSLIVDHCIHCIIMNSKKRKINKQSEFAWI